MHGHECSPAAPDHHGGCFAFPRRTPLPDHADPFALLTATQAAEYADVTVQAVVNWRNRCHLAPAGMDGRGRPLYRLIDVARAELATRAKAGRPG